MKPLAALFTLALLVLGTGAHAQEHPEHPAQKNDQESVGMMTLDELADAITRYIDRDSKLKGGFFLVYDPDEKKPLMLRLQTVHKDRLSALGDGVYFACTDMKSDNGVVYDLDFFMKRTESGIEATDVAIHKRAGKPRYGWKEEGGIWKKVKI